MRARMVLAMCLLGACGSHRDEGTSPPPPPEGPVTCTVEGVASARPVEMITLPAGCRLSGGGTPTAPRVVHDADELASILECETRPDVDLTTHDLYVVTITMSPAFGGSETLDDGTTITHLTRFRSPCPDDPMPMPMNATAAYRLPKGATRTFREANCTLPPRCR